MEAVSARSLELRQLFKRVQLRFACSETWALVKQYLLAYTRSHVDLQRRQRLGLSNLNTSS